MRVHMDLRAASKLVMLDRVYQAKLAFDSTVVSY